MGKTATTTARSALASFAALIFLCGAAPGTIATMPVSRLDQSWWKARFEAKQIELRSHRPDLLWLGDSITQNWESDGPEPWRTFAPIWNRFYGDRHAVNLGFKGDSTCHLLWRLRHGELDDISPRAVILLIGANNFGHVHTNAIQTYAGIQVVLDEIHRRLPHAQILLLGVLPSVRSSWVSTNTSQLNDMLQSHAGERRDYLTFVDLNSIFVQNSRIDREKYLDPKLSPPDPPLHPTATAQEEMAAKIEPVVARMLGDHVHR